MIIIHSSIKHNFVTVVSKLSKGKIPSESDDDGNYLKFLCLCVADS